MVVDQEVLALHERLQKAKFFGTVVEKWENGVVVRAMVEQSLQPKDFRGFEVTIQI